MKMKSIGLNVRTSDILSNGILATKQPEHRLPVMVLPFHWQKGLRPASVGHAESTRYGGSI